MRHLLGMTQCYSPDLEYRTVGLAVRETATSTNGNVVRGTAVVFERWQKVAQRDARAVAGESHKREKVTVASVNLPDLSEFVNDALDQELRKTHNDVRALINHDNDKYLGSMFKRSLKFTKTDRSLDFELTVPETTLGNDLLGIMRNESGAVAMSVGFVSKGRKSNTKTVNMDDEPTTDDTTAGKKTTIDNTPINLQNGKLDGSDYVEGINVKTGRNWRVYKNFDLREISFLVGQEPAWQGVYAQIGSGKPVPSSADQARRERELIMLELRC